MSPAVDKVNKKIEIVEKVNPTMTDYSQIALNPLQHVLTTVEKKVRNLDKRKVKLDGYRKTASEGGTLDRDQTAAVSKYGEVSGSLDFAKELYKSLGSLQTEVMKSQRKIQRQEEENRQDNQRQQFEFVAKCQFVFKLFMENKTIAEDFINGTNSATVIPQEELEDILKFYENFIAGVKHDVSINVLEKALSAAEHMELLHDGNEAHVCGTTYKNLRATLDKLLACSYFTNLPELNQETESLGEDDEEQEEEYVEDEEVEGSEEAPLQEESEEEDQGKDETDAVPISPTEDCDSVVAASPDPTNVEPSPVQSVQTIEDVLAGVQGEYNFLQDSMLDYSGGDNIQSNGLMKPIHNDTPDLPYNPNLPPSNIGMENLHGYSDGAEMLKHNDAIEVTHNTVPDTFYSQRTTENDNMMMPAATNDIDHFRNDVPPFKEQAYQNFDRTNQMKRPYTYIPPFPLDPMSSHNPGMPPSTLPSIDPPTTHIPLPNEEDSGYHAYTSDNLDEKKMTAKERGQPTHPHDDDLMSMKLQKPSENVDNAYKEEVVKVDQNKSHPEGLAMREKDARDQRNNRPNNHPGMGYRPHDRQPNNGMPRQRGNYRSNNANRNFGGHFDSMGHPKNYGPQSNYQNQPYGYQNNRSQDNQMYGNMQRRGAGGNGRPNRGYPPRGNMNNRGMGNNPMNRTRNMKNLKPEQPA